MDFQLSDEQRLISETARDFADGVIAPRVKENDRAARFDRELASKLGEVGYLGAPVAEAYGGGGPPHLTFPPLVGKGGPAPPPPPPPVSPLSPPVSRALRLVGGREQISK